MSCKICFNDGIFDRQKLQQVRERVLPILQGVGMKISADLIRIELVDRTFLDREALRIKAGGKLRD